MPIVLINDLLQFIVMSIDLCDLIQRDLSIRDMVAYIIDQSLAFASYL